MYPCSFCSHHMPNAHSRADRSSGYRAEQRASSSTPKLRAVASTTNSFEPFLHLLRFLQLLELTETTNSHAYISSVQHATESGQLLETSKYKSRPCMRCISWLLYCDTWQVRSRHATERSRWVLLGLGFSLWSTSEDIIIKTLLASMVVVLVSNNFTRALQCSRSRALQK